MGKHSELSLRGARAYDSTGFRVGRRFGGSQRSQDGERGGQVFERVRFGPAAGHVEQLPQQQHGGVRLAGTADALKHRHPGEWFINNIFFIGKYRRYTAE